MPAPPLTTVYPRPFKKGDRVRLKIFDPVKDTGIKGSPQHMPDQQGTVTTVTPGQGNVYVTWDGDSDMGEFEEDPDDLVLVKDDFEVEDF